MGTLPPQPERRAPPHHCHGAMAPWRLRIGCTISPSVNTLPLPWSIESRIGRSTIGNRSSSRTARGRWRSTSSSRCGRTCVSSCGASAYGTGGRQRRRRREPPWAWMTPHCSRCSYDGVESKRSWMAALRTVEADPHPSQSLICPSGFVRGDQTRVRTLAYCIHLIRYNLRAYHIAYTHMITQYSIWHCKIRTLRGSGKDVPISCNQPTQPLVGPIMESFEAAIHRPRRLQALRG